MLIVHTSAYRVPNESYDVPINRQAQRCDDSSDDRNPIQLHSSIVLEQLNSRTRFVQLSALPPFLIFRRVSNHQSASP
jgi:hypothetical protein